jgi:hypothetical protein
VGWSQEGAYPPFCLMGSGEAGEQVGNWRADFCGGTGVDPAALGQLIRDFCHEDAATYFALVQGRV